MTIMDVHYQSLAQLLPEREYLEITYNRDEEIINITTDDVMIYSDTAARIFAYCAKHDLRCWIAYSYVRQKIKLGITKNI